MARPRHPRPRPGARPVDSRRPGHVSGALHGPGAGARRGDGANHARHRRLTGREIPFVPADVEHTAAAVATHVAAATLQWLALAAVGAHRVAASPSGGHVRRIPQFRDDGPAAGRRADDLQKRSRHGHAGPADVQHRLERVELEDAVPGAPAQTDVEIGVQAGPLQRRHGVIPRYTANSGQCNNRAPRARGGLRAAPYLTQIAPFVLDFTAASMNSTPCSPSATVGNKTSPSGRWPPRAARIAWATSV